MGITLIMSGQIMSSTRGNMISVHHMRDTDLLRTGMKAMKGIGTHMIMRRHLEVHLIVHLLGTLHEAVTGTESKIETRMVLQRILLFKRTLLMSLLIITRKKNVSAVRWAGEIGIMIMPKIKKSGMKNLEKGDMIGKKVQETGSRTQITSGTEKTRIVRERTACLEMPTGVTAHHSTLILAIHLAIPSTDRPITSLDKNRGNTVAIGSSILIHLQFQLSSLSRICLLAAITPPSNAVILTSPTAQLHPVTERLIPQKRLDLQNCLKKEGLRELQVGNH
jgi:hypothetical protein